jgi:hypothetical protein
VVSLAQVDVKRAINCWVTQLYDQNLHQPKIFWELSTIILLTILLNADQITNQVSMSQLVCKRTIRPTAVQL